MSAALNSAQRAILLQASRASRGDAGPPAQQGCLTAAMAGWAAFFHDSNLLWPHEALRTISTFGCNVKEPGLATFGDLRQCHETRPRHDSVVRRRLNDVRRGPEDRRSSSADES